MTLLGVKTLKDFNATVDNIRQAIRTVIRAMRTTVLDIRYLTKTESDTAALPCYYRLVHVMFLPVPVFVYVPGVPLAAFAA